MIKLQLQSKTIYLLNESISQVLEVQSNIVVVSTMSCMYYKVNLKTGVPEFSFPG